MRRRAMAIAEAHDDHSAYARATTAHQRAAVGALRPARFAGDVGGRRGARTRRGRRVAARGWSRVPGAARARVAGPVRRGRGTRARVHATSPSARSTRWSSDCRSPRSRRSRSPAVDFDQAEQYAHRALLLQRLSGYHWAAGLFLPAARVRVRRRAASSSRRTTALATWSETADAMEQASVDLFSRWVTACERRLAVLGAPLPGLPLHPMVGGTRGRCWRSSSRSGKARPATCTPARDLLAEIERLGGVLIGGTASLAARHLGVAQGPPRRRGRRHRHPAARHRARPRARARCPSWRGAQPTSPSSGCGAASSGEGFALLDEAVATFRALGLEYDVARAEQLSGTAPERSRSSRSRPTPASIILFTDVVDSTRLTEELGAGPYRARARLVERAITGAIDSQRRHRRHRHQPGRRLHRPLPDGGPGPRRGAAVRRRRRADRPAPPRRRCTRASSSSTATASTAARSTWRPGCAR